MLLLGIMQVSAQENITVQITKLAIDSTMEPAFLVEIPQADSKSAIKMWENRLVPKNLFNTFTKQPNMEKEAKDKWYMHGVVIEEICTDTLSVYTRITTLKDRISFATLLKSPTGFIGSDANSETSKRASTYLRSHAIEVYKLAVQEELDELEKELKRMKNDYTGLNKDNQKLDQKSSESQSSLNTLNAPSNKVEEKVEVLTEEQMEARLKDIKKEEKALKKYSNKMDKNTDRQNELVAEIGQKEDEIKAVKQKLLNIK